MKQYASGVLVAILSVAMILGCKKEVDNPAQPIEMTKEEIKTEIVRLENAHVRAILKKDSAALHSIMDASLLVNNPRNTVTVGSSGVISRLVSGELDHTSYLFQMEQILINNNTVVTMGSETVIPANGPDAGKTVKRRYSQVWINVDGKWKMFGRHANVIL